MQSFYESISASYFFHPQRTRSLRDGVKAALFAVCTMLTWLLFPPILQAARPVGPVAPSGLAATAISNTRIDLSWTDNSGDETGFKIEIKLGAAGTYSQIAMVGANVTTYSSTGLDASTEYFYRVRSYNAGGNSAYSNEANATTKPDPPASPSALNAAPLSNTQINLAWTDNSSNESGFKIERKLSSAVTYTQIATVGANVTNYTSGSLAANTAYSYRVFAYNAGGNSGYSNVASATTLPNPPAAPSALTATEVSNTQIDLAWSDNANSELGFIVERKTGAEGAYAVIDTVSANLTAYASTGLSGSTEYFYQVRAYNTGGNSAYSNEASATTLPDPPAAPTNLTAVAVSNEQINLAWSDNVNTEDGFKIELKIGAAGTYTEIAEVGANVTSYASTGLEAGTQYFCRVRAFNAGGNSPYSNEANATTLPDPPAAPSGLTATTMSDTQIDLAWTDHANSEDGFKIERKLSSGVSYTQIATVGANVTSYSNTSLTPNTGYSYRVRAFNASGNSSYSNVAGDTTLISPPSAPSGLSATTINKTQINLAWTDNANNEQGFTIERKVGPGGAYAEIAAVDMNITTYSNTGLTPGTQYFYRVRAFNSTDSSAYTEEANATTLPNAPAAPTVLTAATISNTQIDLAWTDNAGNETGFKIERKTFGGTYTQIATAGANVTSFSNTGLNPITQYFYRVRANNAGGNSAFSNEANATTFPNLPKAPGDLTATTVSNTQINLAWADSSDNEDGFKVERKTGVDGTFAEIITVGADVTSFASTGLSPNTLYFFRVRAYNAGGNSDYTNEANATTLPNIPVAPDSLIATTVSKSRIDLAWGDGADNEDGFKIERKIGAAGTFAEITSLGPNATNYSNTGLSPNTQYFYRVRAFNTGGNSAYSNEANAKTLPNVPKNPSGLIATTLSNTQIGLAWVDSSNNESGFKIERKILGGAFVQIATVGANVTSHTNSGLQANTQYFYRVRAYNPGGNSLYSNEDEATTLPNLPGAPDSLTATTMSNTQINLAWADSADNEDGFKIERKTGIAGTFAEVATVGPDVTNFSNTGLSANTNFFYRVRAFNAGGHSNYSNEANAKTLPNIPKAPGGLTATTISKSQIDLAWADSSSNEDGFKIERKTGPAGTFAEIAFLGPDVTSYSNTGLGTNTQYFYRVRAHNVGGNSAYSNEANAKTLPNVPKGPSGLTATAVSSSQINLAWADSSNGEEGFKIERKTGAAGTYGEIATLGVDVTSYSNPGLNANTSYFYRVRAFNAGGNSVYSNEANAKTPPNIPKAPGNLTATTMSNTQIDLAWADSSNNETGFKIERKIGVAGAFAEIAALGANVTSYSNTGLNANTQYFYRVRAHNAGGNSAYTNEANAQTLPNIPEAPEGLTATAISNTQIDLAWADSSNGEEGFKIERKVGAAGTYAEITTVGVDVTSYSNTGLNVNTTYFYRVRAFNAGGNSPYSNEANAKTLPTIPKGPGGLAATTVSNAQINLAWADSSNNETGFKIERKAGSGGTYAQINTVGANVTAFSDSTGLNPNTQYFYRVRAYNGGGNSTYSNEANAKTLPDKPKPPSNLTATAISKSRINLAWADSSNNETGFKIERKTGSAGTYAQIKTVGANVKTVADSTGLNPNTQYFYRVRAYNAGGNSAYSNAANAKTLPNKPKAPSNLTATAANSSRINLAWADSANNETGFKIERKIGAAGTFAQIAAVGANVKSYADSIGLSPDTQYFYRVRSYNTGGNSAYSNTANATTEPTTPNAPSNLTATAVSSGQINLAWTDNAGTEIGFKIERKTGAAGTYAQIATVGANLTSYSNTGLNASTQYYYRVRAHNGGGNSPYSNEANATTLSNGTNLALNKPATALNTDSTSAPGNAVDGNAITYWRSGFVNASNPTSWLRVELHPTTSVLIGRAVVKWHQDYFAEQYELQVSTDGTAWTAVHINNAGTLGTQDFTFTPVLAKFVRLYLKMNSKSNYRVLELEVYAGSGAAPKNADDEVEVTSMPETIALEQNYPNPFNPSTQIRYALPQTEHVTLAIFNSIGQEVRRLVHREQPAGFHIVTWNGRDLHGNPMPSGVYHYRLQVGDFITTKRMTLAK